MFFEEGDHFIIHLCTVLDRVYTVLQSNLNAFGTFHVRCDIEAELMCFVACGFYIFRRHTKDTGFSDLFCIQYTAGDHEFDKVRIVFGNDANQFSCMIRTLRFICERAGHVSTGNRDCHVGYKHPGSVDQAFVDVIAKT